MAALKHMPLMNPLSFLKIQRVSAHFLEIDVRKRTVRAISAAENKYISLGRVTKLAKQGLSAQIENGREGWAIWFWMLLIS